MTHASLPEANAASASRRSSGLTAEWWMCTDDSRSLSGSTSRSARLRLSTKMRDFLPRTASAAASMREKKSGFTQKVNAFLAGGEGTRTNCFCRSGADIQERSSSGLPTVAESPILMMCSAEAKESRSKRQRRCTPREVSINAWISSMITNRRRENACFASLSPRRTSRDSGVVKRMSGSSPP